MTRSRGFGAEREILALQIGQRIDRSIPSNEHRAEFLVFFTLHNWNHLAAATYISLNESKAAELHQIELVVQQPPPHGRSVIGNPCKFDLYAQLLFQITA